MANVKFELNREGVRELLQSPEMLAVCEEYANNAVAQLGEGYEASTYVGKSRVNASVIATTYKARKENSETNSILKAVGG
jgi:hypothetical protein